MPSLYSDTLPQFLAADPDALLGKLTSGLADEGFDTSTLTTFSWQEEITDLQTALQDLLQSTPAAAHWIVLLEYVLPVIGKRLDCVLLAHDVIFVLEYKGGHSTTARSALQQAQDYACNLADFHEESRDRTVIPLAVGRFKRPIPLSENSEHHGAAVTPTELSTTLAHCHTRWGTRRSPIEPARWNLSRYFPVPTIIEAASAIYREHDVKDLARSRAGADNLEITQTILVDAVRDAIQRGVKKLLIVTGVPGAGKTLAGLNAVQKLTQELDLNTEQASFLSGNGPLVAVIQEALKRSVGPRKKGVSRSIASRVREVHRFVRDSYAGTLPPADRLIVFDEAQRAWTAARNLKKFDRNISEPDMVFEIMGRHTGWAVIIALVGGGQEIHGGEAGLAEWGDALQRHPAWSVHASPEAIHGGPSVAGSRLFRATNDELPSLTLEAALHLAVSKRSFETDVTAAWVNAVLDGRADDAATLATRRLPIYATRDLAQARAWLRARATGTRRAGLIASSGAARLRADGVEPPTFNFMSGIEYVKWFLEPHGDYRSSNQLEIALSEFELQGLELDLTGLLWGGDLAFPNGIPTPRALQRFQWRPVSPAANPSSSADDPETRIKNKYRVLLTRFRKAMVIFVPQGDDTDPTRSPQDFNEVYAYLLRCGTIPLKTTPVENSITMEMDLFSNL